MGLTHFDEARSRERSIGHLKGRWTLLGESAGSVVVGARRIEFAAGGWSTPAHEHGREEEIFYVLDGRGLSWQAGRTAAVRAGDCIVYRPGQGAHSLHALEPLDILAFGQREYDECVGFPRLGISLVGNRAVESVSGAVDGAPVQFVREAELGPPELPPDVGPRPSTIVNVDEVEPTRFGRGRVMATRRNLGRAAGSVKTGIQHVKVDPGRDSVPQHCHSLEEELFVILDGDAVLVLDEEESPVRAGSVVARPAGTGVAHMFRAGARGLTYLAYGTREPGDICFYPRSSKLFFRGLGVVARIERLDYWDGEE
ncbi:MAG: cupin domain-containing protein [Solirubrobacterales bacterium]|nr:cupin domain-containing protein [Solirubrobacterales bacterium]